jgi:hypothetical protein
MSGRATFTAEMSRMTISCATRSVPSSAGRAMLPEVGGERCVIAAILSVIQTSLSEILNQTAVSDVNRGAFGL